MIDDDLESDEVDEDEDDEDIIEVGKVWTMSICMIFYNFHYFSGF